MAFPVDKEVPSDYSDRTRDNLNLLEPRNRLRPNKWWSFSGVDRSFVQVQTQPSKSSLTSSHEEIYGYDDTTADNSVFSDARAAELYKPIEKFEGRHRFDLKATWTEEEEKKLVRRVSTNLFCYAHMHLTKTADVC